MRRRPPRHQQIEAGQIQVLLDSFDPDDWPGATDALRFEAWHESVMDQITLTDAYQSSPFSFQVPDAPFDPTGEDAPYI
ncbi:hypothetical protein M3D92_03395 [Micrococcus terreus]|uniref:hypothetical protein n=1 Tax=Micrococcus terreus TaxID=574650 RepID=UPI0021A6FF81|nr:hypothetical protein [Micrococcus terreus]MCT2088346.1 hypothetical protein [Micrococcus terreus]